LSFKDFAVEQAAPQPAHAGQAQKLDIPQFANSISDTAEGKEIFLFVEFDDGGLGNRPQLRGSGAQGIGRLRGLASLNATQALTTLPDVVIMKDRSPARTAGTASSSRSQEAKLHSVATPPPPPATQSIPARGPSKRTPVRPNSLRIITLWHGTRHQSLAFRGIRCQGSITLEIVVGPFWLLTQPAQGTGCLPHGWVADSGRPLRQDQRPGLVHSLCFSRAGQLAAGGAGKDYAGEVLPLPSTTVCWRWPGATLESGKRGRLSSRVPGLRHPGSPPTCCSRNSCMKRRHCSG